MKNADYFRQTLLARKQRLTHRVHSIDRDIRHEGMSADWGEQATERENDEVLESLGIASAQELQSIKQALKRLDNGDYFYCSRCGEEIPTARLELLPYTTLCVSCAEAREGA